MSLFRKRPENPNGPRHLEDYRCPLCGHDMEKHTSFCLVTTCNCSIHCTDLVRMGRKWIAGNSGDPEHDAAYAVALKELEGE